MSSLVQHQSVHPYEHQSNGKVINRKFLPGWILQTKQCPTCKARWFWLVDREVLPATKLTKEEK